MENPLRFSLKEQNIRKKWLFWQITLPACVIGIVTLGALVSLILNFSWMIFLSILALAIFSVATLYISYYCAYKHPGTIYLLLSLIGISIELIMECFNQVQEILKESNRIDTLIVLSLFSVSTLYKLRLFYLSYKLRQINENIQKKRLKISEENP